MTNLTAKQLFLIDGLGALVSAFMLGIILVYLEPIFGIPKQVLYFLAMLPCCFAVYDAYCYTRNKSGMFLKGIAVANLVYSLISLGLGLYHIELITIWGWTYIIMEVLIIFILAILEYKIGSQ